MAKKNFKQHAATQHIHVEFFLVLMSALVIFIILRIPSLFEGHWYGDEGVYAAVSQALEHGKRLYIDVWDNKPPGIYILYGLGDSFNRLAVVKLLNIIAGVFGVLGISALARTLKFGLAGYTASLATIVYLLGTPIYEGNIANAENFFVPMIIWGIYYALKKGQIAKVISGLIFGFAFWLKFHPLFDFAAVGFALLFILTRPTSVNGLFKTAYDAVWPYVQGFAVAVGIMIAYIALISHVPTAFRTIFLGNVSYSQVYDSVFLTFEAKTIGLILGIAAIYFLYWKKYLDKTVSFLIILLLFEFYGSMTSGRRYTHYLLQTVPALSLLTGYFVHNIIEASKGAESSSGKRNPQLKQLRKYSITAAAVFVMYAGGLALFIQGEGQLLDTQPSTYYLRFFEKVQSDTLYQGFPHNTEYQIALINTALDVRYNGLSAHIYSDNPWYLDATQTPTQISFVAAYHQLLRPNGPELYQLELQLSDPDIIVVDRDSVVTEEVFQYIAEEYVIDYEDEYFSYYTKSFESFADKNTMNTL